MVDPQRNNTVQTFPPQRADEPLAERIGLRSPHWRLEHPQPQVAHTLVELLREDAIAVMDQELVGMVSGNRFAKLLECPRCSGMGRHMGVEDTTRGVFHHHKHVEQTKRGCDHHAEVACHDRLGVVADKRPPAL